MSSSDSATVVPTDEEVLATMKALYDKEVTLGIDKSLKHIKAAQPSWAINSKRLREIREKCNLKEAVALIVDAPVNIPINKPVEKPVRSAKPAVPSTASKASTAPPKSRAPEIPRPQSDGIIATDPLLVMLSPIKDRDFSAISREDVWKHFAEDLYGRYINPPGSPVVPPAPFVENYEAMAFFMLYPYGQGHWLGPKGHPDMTFDEFVQARLQLGDSRFRSSPQWLTWALTRVEEESTKMRIAYLLYRHFGVKARHVGNGKVQVKADFRVPWEPVTLVDGQLAPLAESP